MAVGQGDRPLEHVLQLAHVAGEAIGAQPLQLDRLGEVGLMVDPDGNPIGLMEIEDFVHYSYRWGKHRIPLTREQYEDHMVALRLSQDLLFEERDGVQDGSKADKKS